MRRLIHSGVQNHERLLRDGLGGEVQIIDDDDSLFFNIADRAGPHCIVAEAEYQDSDGMLVSVIAHTVDDRLAEIEIFKADGSRLKTALNVGKVDVFWPAESGKKGWWSSVDRLLMSPAEAGSGETGSLSARLKSCPDTNRSDTEFFSSR